MSGLKSGRSSGRKAGGLAASDAPQGPLKDCEAAQPHGGTCRAWQGRHTGTLMHCQSSLHAAKLMSWLLLHTCVVITLGKIAPATVSYQLLAGSGSRRRSLAVESGQPLCNPLHLLKHVWPAGGGRHRGRGDVRPTAGGRQLLLPMATLKADFVLPPSPHAQQSCTALIPWLACASHLCCLPSANSGLMFIYCVPSPKPTPQPSPATAPHMPPADRPATPSGAPPKPHPALGSVAHGGTRSSGHGQH